MTLPRSSPRVLRAALAASVATAVLMTGALWLQHARGRWPFTRPAPPGPAVVALSPDDGAARVDRVPVDVPISLRESLGMRFETVARHPIATDVRAVAVVAPDESRIAHVHTRVAGWLETLDVKTTGESVHAGQPVARIFSQDLFASQVEYLAARRSTSSTGLSSAVVASGRTRLSVLGMTAEEIAEIEATGEPRRLVTVVSPARGVVLTRGVTEGTAVDPSTALLTIADMSRVWILAEVPETSIPDVRSGARTIVDIAASGRGPFAVRAEFIHPTLTEGTRTLRVRLPADNPGGHLRPGMYGTATFQTSGRTVLTVPREAVVDTGTRQHVFVVDGDRFEPRAVRLGARLSDRVEVTEGLTEGERIVASGVFLLDSESRLRASGGTGGHDHDAPMGTPAPAAADDSGHSAHGTPSARVEPVRPTPAEHRGH
jgi:Cu(I)/Ag(I) efflux system membrane fusion protein